MAAAIGATPGTAQIPAEVAQNRCEGKPEGAACWQKLANQPECHIWTESFDRDRAFSWTGKCRAGLAHGEGVFAWSSDPPPEAGRLPEGRFSTADLGAFKDGRKDGKWVEYESDGMTGSRSEGNYVKGRKHGHWVADFGMFSLEGPYVEGKKHGEWIVRGGPRFEIGPYAKGNKHGKWLFIWLHSMRPLTSLGDPEFLKKLPAEVTIYENGTEVPEPSANQAGIKKAEPDVETQTEALVQSSPQIKKPHEIKPLPDCGQWNTEGFFRNAAVEDVTTCLEAGANVNAGNRRKSTPLHYASGFNRNPAVVQVLLEAGAELEAQNQWKHTPLHYAAGLNEDLAVIEVLLKAGADSNARDEDGETPLHEAARFNKNPAVIEALLKAGVDPNARDDYEETPLHEAAWFNKNPVVIEGLSKATGATEKTAFVGTLPPAKSGGRSGRRGQCQMPDYPKIDESVSNLGFPWCPVSVSIRVRAFALRAAGAQCAIDTGRALSQGEVEASEREIRAACDRLAALGQGNCQCPPDLR